jgi:hypothetical protein
MYLPAKIYFCRHKYAIAETKESSTAIKAGWQHYQKQNYQCLFQNGF